MSRWYHVPVTRDRLAQAGTYDDLLDQFVNSDAVKARRLHLDDSFWTVTGGSLYVSVQNESYDLGSREAEAVLAAVGRDLANGDWGTYDWFRVSNGGDYAMDLSLEFDGPDGEGHDYISISLTPAMGETVAALRQLGLVTDVDLVTYRELEPEDYAWEQAEADASPAAAGRRASGGGPHRRRGDPAGRRGRPEPDRRKQRRGGDPGMSKGKRQRRRTNPRFAALCLVLIFALAGIGVWLWGSRGLRARVWTAPDYVTEDLLPVNAWSRPGTPLEKIDGVVIHYVGNPATTAQANRNYFASPGRQGGGHLRQLPLPGGAGGGGHPVRPSDGDRLRLQHPQTRTRWPSSVCHPDETGLFSDVTYARTVELTAWLCRTFDLDPETDVIRHYDVTGKICPKYYVEHPEAWEGFLADTAAEMARQAEAEP